MCTIRTNNIIPPHTHSHNRNATQRKVSKKSQAGGCVSSHVASHRHLAGIRHVVELLPVLLLLLLELLQKLLPLLVLLQGLPEVYRVQVGVGPLHLEIPRAPRRGLPPCGCVLSWGRRRCRRCCFVVDHLWGRAFMANSPTEPSTSVVSHRLLLLYRWIERGA